MLRLATLYGWQCNFRVPYIAGDYVEDDEHDDEHFDLDDMDDEAYYDGAYVYCGYYYDVCPCKIPYNTRDRNLKGI